MEKENNMFLTLNDLKIGANEEGDCGNSSNEQPHWYDHEKFCRGQLFFQKHVAAIGFSMHLSLVSGFSIINLLEPLVFTKASNTPKKSLKRYLLTFYHIFLWMTCDVWDKTSKAYNSLKTVRGMHNSTAKAMKAKLGGPIKVSQYDMALVQSGFFAAALMYPEGFGIKCTKEELTDYVFTWRVIGYLLGVDDKYNICGQDSYEATYALCKEIETQCLWPALQSTPTHFDELVDAYIDGLNLTVPVTVHSKASALALIYDGFGRKEISYKMGLLDWVRFYFWKFYFFLISYYSGFERFMNNQILHNFVRDMEKMHNQDIQEEVKMYL